VEIVYVSIISSIFGLIGLLIWQRGNLVTWAAKMDYKAAEYGHKEKIEAMRTKKSIDRLALQKSNPTKTSDLLGNLANLDLDQVGEILEKAQDLKEGTGEEGGLLSLLNSPIVQGLLAGVKKKGGDNTSIDDSIIYEK
jgi:hypothetical protein